MAGHWTDDPTKNRAREVPQRHLDRLAAQFPEPRSPMGPRPEAWAKMLHDLALEIWAEAYTAGAAHGAAISITPRIVFVTEEQQAAMAANLAKVNAEIIAEIEQRVAEAG